MKLKTALKKIFKNPAFKKIGLIFGLVIISLGILIFSYNLAYKDKIFPQTFIGGINFGGKTQAEAVEILKSKVNENASGKMELKFNDKQWTIKAEEVNLQYEPIKSAEIAWQVGRQGNFTKIAQEQLKSIFGGNKKKTSFTFDKNKLNSAILAIANEVDIPEKDATIVIRELTPEIVAEQTGQKVDFAKNQEAALSSFGLLKGRKTLDLKIDKINPKITKEGAENAKEEAVKILKEKITLKFKDKTYNLEGKDFAPWLDFVGVMSEKLATSDDSTGIQKLGVKSKTTIKGWQLKVQINSEKLNAYVEQLASEINQEPKDAKFEVQGGKVKAFQLSQTGYSLDKEKTVELITKALFDNGEEIALPVKITEPDVATNSAENLGIKEIVGEGTTNFSGSPQNRRHNIAVGANSFHGVMIKPGEEFSMLKYLGQVDASSGYLPELVIKEDRTVPEYGGGLCQVSTTMFRAALNAGFKITERQNHSYRVRYYEPPVGMDATIYIPKPDFKFIDDLSSSILIQTEINGDNLTFSFYGTKDGRRTETTDPYVYDVIGSGEPIYTESPDLAPGEIKRIETAHPGSKATFTYRVYDASGKLTNEQKFDSSYVPWPARYLYGPGTTIPPAE